MIISSKNSKIKLLIPDGYSEIKQSRLFAKKPEMPKGTRLYRKDTDNAVCIAACVQICENASMTFDDNQAIIGKVHANLTENQGIISVDSGLTHRGYKYAYYLIKEVDMGDIPTGVAYFLKMDIADDSDIIEIQAQFAEAGTTGMRDTIGHCLAEKAGLLTNSPLEGWNEDPYDSSYTKGIPMNLAEREGLDGMFPEHPLSQAREFIHTIVTDELIRPITKAAQEEKGTDGDTQITEEEALKLLFSKDSKRNFIPEKIDIEQKSNVAVPLSVKESIKKATSQGSDIVLAGAAIAKKGTDSAAHEIGKTVNFMREKGKEAQMEVLSYIDNKKNKRFLEAKLSAFEDGLKQGKVDAVDYVKKFVDYYLAVTALSFYFARADGSIQEEEQKQIDKEMGAIIRNKDLPENVRKALIIIAEDENLSFEDVRKYLDRVSIETVLAIREEMEEIINADGIESDSEKEARMIFEKYVSDRQEKSNG